MTIVTQLKGKIEDKPTKLLCGFFGTGMTWGSMSFTTDNIVISELVEVDNIEE
jgi:3-oxoacyl-[acyl-carrier-protein] synthase-3